MSTSRHRMLVPLVIPLVLLGCSSSQKNSSDTLSLLLAGNEGRLHVKEYRILDNTFKNSQQQGLYQAHLMDGKGYILQKISFEKLELPASSDSSGNSGFYVALPLKPNLSRVLFYRLDGRSGHYQLKADEPLLDWKVPERVKEKI